MPALGPGDALVAVSHCGICGTDIHLVLEGMGRPGSGLGHEWAGTLAALGDDVDRVGARRAGRGRAGAGVRQVPFVPARPAVRVPAARASRLPRVPRRVRALHQGRRVAAAARPRLADDPRGGAHRADRGGDARGHVSSGAVPGDRVLVTGGGPVGLLVTAVLVANGIDDVTVSEPAPRRREQALAVGARSVVEPDTFPKVSPATPVPEPFQVVFECSGRPEAVRDRAHPARLRGHVRVRRYRRALPDGQPQPGDRVREHHRRRVQLRRGRVRARPRPARLGSHAPRRADRGRRRDARRPARRAAAVCGGRAVGQGDDRPRGRCRERGRRRTGRG